MNMEIDDSVAGAVEHVFKVMAATYGAAWDRALGIAPSADVKTIWANALGDFTHSQDAKRSIMWALKNLPDDVPNARKFRTLCLSAPKAATPMLPSPTVNPEISAKVFQAFSAAKAMRVDPRDWARRIIADAEAGVKKSPTVLRMAKDALGVA